jgi:hypothetical protein
VPVNVLYTPGKTEPLIFDELLTAEALVGAFSGGGGSVIK